MLSLETTLLYLAPFKGTDDKFKIKTSSAVRSCLHQGTRVRLGPVHTRPGDQSEVRSCLHQGTRVRLGPVYTRGPE